MFLIKLIFLSLLFSSSLVFAGVVDFSPGLLRYATDKWGSEAQTRLQNWRDTVLDRVRVRHENKTPSGVFSKDDLQYINTMWNKISYFTDMKHWGVDDYWATPVEMLGSNGGDCEDYAIGKYFSLKELGIPTEKLRITYVRARSVNAPHMVLAYYPTPDADPYILDILTDKILPASQRTDLEPIYSFNDDNLWAAGAFSYKGRSSQIRLWRELLAKMDKERQM